MIEFFKDGNCMALRTDCKDEDEFVSQFCTALDRMISDGSYMNDWDFQLSHWLPQFVELVCAYRGYKTDASKEIVLAVGDRMLGERPAHVHDPDRERLGKIEFDKANEGMPVEAR